MEPIKVTLCPDSGHCPSVEIDEKGVRIGEHNNTVILSHAAWNDLVARIRIGELKSI
jgi:hypothetical protein